jgi:hypothetical protein
LITVAVALVRANVWSLHLQLAFNGAKMKTSNRQQQKDALRLVKPDLRLLPRGNSVDPRLVELVRLLARRAARQVFEEQVKGGRAPRS